jgi:hypothetical protein
MSIPIRTDAGRRARTTLLTAIVAERSGRNRRMTLRMARPTRSCASRATVRCASIASRLP